jgi:uncharacterized OB-fold protein
MSDSVYLVIMVGIVLLTTVVTLPALLMKRCAVCGRRSLVDTRICRGCGAEFPVDSADE